jgi:amino-acid N-acetyltransferase
VIQLDHGTDADLPAIRDLLVGSSLPLDGLMDVPTTLVVARDQSRVVGAGALERHGRDALLRSLVVAPAVRAAGIGSGIVTELERHAASDGIEGIYLLTDTAAGFFSRRGYRRIGRDDAPEAVRGSVEWAVACGASAIPMVRLAPAR